MKVLAFIGPSGSGKSTVVRALQASGLIALTPSWTTRPRRRDEIEGEIEHRFVTDDEFTTLEQRGFFLAVVTMFGLAYRYGLPAIHPPARDAVPTIMVRAPLLPLVARHFPDHIVYQVESNFDDGRDRVLARQRPAAEVGTRLADFERERVAGREAAARVFDSSTSLPELIGAVRAAIEEDFSVERSTHR